MDARTLKALKGSIAKWEGVVAGTTQGKGGDNCPLCKIFAADKPLEYQCAGCPVFSRSGYRWCHATPYIAFAESCNSEGMASTSPARQAARAELAFLKSLLPEPKKKPTQKPAKRSTRRA